MPTECSELAALLRAAADLWFSQNGQPGAMLTANYSTGANSFVHEAEHAWFDAANAWEARPENQPPRPLAALVPEAAWGVYHLIGAEDRVLYVGMSGKPRKRIKAHVAEFGDRLRDVRWHPCSTRVEALDLEAVHIAAIRPPLNVAGL